MFSTTRGLDERIWLWSIATVLAVAVFAVAIFLSTAKGDSGLVVTAHVSGTQVTSVTVDGAEYFGAESLKVELLDGDGVLLGEGCATSADSSDVLIDIVPDTAQWRVAEVKALGVASC